MKFWSILINRLRILFSDKLFVLAMLIIPIILSLITGYAMRREKLGYIPIVLVDEDKTETSQLLCERLLEKEGLKTELAEKERALSQLSEDRVEAMVVIEEGFEDSLMQDKIDGTISLVRSPSTYSSELLSEIISSEVLRIYTREFTFKWLEKSYKTYGVDASGLTREEVFEKYESYWYPEPIMEIEFEEIEVSPGANETVSIPSFAAASLGLMILFIMLALLFGSGWLCEEKANGTLRRLMSVRGAALPVFIGNIAALFIMGLFMTLVFTGVQGLIYGTPLLKGWIGWLVVSAYVLCAASLSMLLAASFETPNQLQAVSPTLALITGIMGGCLWNILGIPESLRTMALLTPQGWALNALTVLYASPGDGKTAASGILCLLGISIIFLAIAYRGFVRACRWN